MTKRAVTIDDDAEREDEASAPAPFQYAITSYGADYPVDSLVKRVRSGDIFVPTFQRHFVWKHPQASRFIESLLLGLPVPGIFLSKDDDTNKLLVIDGQQRLETLRRFYEGTFGGVPFALQSVQKVYEGKTYAELTEEDRRKLDDAIIHATVVRQDSPAEDKSSIYHIFERLNTGGTPLTAQQIRAALYHDKPLTTLLADLNKNTAWRVLMGPVNPKAKDSELILRFIALYEDSASYFQPMKEFLNSFMAKRAKASTATLAGYRAAFEQTILAVKDGLGYQAFKPQRAFNAAVFDAVTVGLARRLAKKNGPVSSATLKGAYEKLLKDPDFIGAYKTGTSALESVRSRLDLATKAFASL